MLDRLDAEAARLASSRSYAARRLLGEALGERDVPASDAAERETPR